MGKLYIKNNRVLSDMPLQVNQPEKRSFKEQQIYDETIEPIKQLDHYNPIKKRFIGEDKLNKKKV